MRQISLGQNWTSVEDGQLCRSWLNISMDPIVGRDQRITVLWERIKQHFDENLGDNVTNHNQASLLSRWNTIQAKVSKFCGFLEQVKNASQQSGSIPINMIPRAMFLYRTASKINETFNLVHCWEILCDAPKWAGLVSNKRDKTVFRAARQRSANSVEDPVVIANDGNHTDEEMVEGSCPPGRKQSKALTQKIRARNEELDRSFEKLEKSDKKRAKLLQIAMDHSVMTMDMSVVTNPRQKRYLEKQMADIHRRQLEEEDETE